MKGRVVVTGASGFLGSYLVAELVSRGEPVVATSRRRPRFLEDAAFKGVTFVPADIRDGKALAPVLDGASRVYHCAALFDFWASAGDLMAVNEGGTAAL